MSDSMWLVSVQKVGGGGGVWHPPVRKKNDKKHPLWIINYDNF